MKIKKIDNTNIAIIEATEKINSVRDISDLMANAYYNECVGLVIKKEYLAEEFFDLKTRIAGEILQKFSNYNMKMSIIGDFSVYDSKSLRDFIYECNNGNLIFFKDTEEAGIDAIISKK